MQEQSDRIIFQKAQAKAITPTSVRPLNHLLNVIQEQIREKSDLHPDHWKLEQFDTTTLENLAGTNIGQFL